MDKNLPIYQVVEDVRESLRQQNTLILQAPPGAGKSTVLPLELLDEEWLSGKKMIMLEPRRLAAKAVANRMAFLLNEEVGETVGYRVRFETKVSGKTRIEVVTEGILTRMLQSDNTLEDVGLVIFDEFHERSLNADLSLLLCREVQQILRPEFRILIMSATLNGEELAAALGSAPVISSEGRQYPVDLVYLGSDDNLPIPQRVTKAIKLVVQKQKGDVLVFLPGAAEIRAVEQYLLEAAIPHTVIHPLYGDLPRQKQQDAISIDKQGRRKIVLATSIAETSLTIEGVTTVVDSGLSRVSKFDSRSGLSRLETVTVTLDVADQRAGRAGRLGPGTCYRLWSAGEHYHLQPHRKPEIIEADLSSLVLELANWGSKDFYHLTWITPPPATAVNGAVQLLEQLGALKDGNITHRGKEMLKLPAHPRIAHMLLEGKENNVVELATDVAALLEERDILERGQTSDLSLRVELLRKWRNRERVNVPLQQLEQVERIAFNWRKIMRCKAENDLPEPSAVGMLVAAAYPGRVAMKQGNGNLYRMVNGQSAMLADNDPLIHEEWLAIAHLDAGKQRGRVFLAAPLDAGDVLNKTIRHEVVSWGSRKKEIIAREEERLGSLTVSSKPLKTVSNEKIVEVICEAVMKEGLQLLNFDEETRNLQARLSSLKAWRPEEDWPDVSDGALLASTGEWLAPFLSGVRKVEELQKLDLQQMILSLVPWDLQQKLPKLAPVKLEVPSGSHIKLQYRAGGEPPILAVRLQEVFGLLDTPRVNEGKVEVLMHLLSPGYKPVQVTQNLRSFWGNTYAEVKKELKSRYPRHSWPEDPFTAEAVRGAKRRR